MIPQETIEEIIERVSPADYIGQWVQLRKSGINMVGRCPFHGDRSPSFYVYPDHFHCFGCGKHGSVIDFVMEHEHMSFREAVLHLARQYNIEVSEGKETEHERNVRLQEENMHACNELVCQDYRKAFLQSAEAQNYAYGRWGKEYCDEIGIGYAPGGRFLSSGKYDNGILKSLGLVNETGDDFFFNRIVIPIRNRWHKVIGFTARRMDGESKFKYLNSRESFLYKKGESLFGIDAALHATKKNGTLYLVEGAPDCMRLHTIGVKSAVASLGTAWTDKHFTMIRRITDTICFIPDGDLPKEGQLYGTGTEAVFKAGRKAMELGFNVSVKAIPNESREKQDPDSYFKDIDTFHRVAEEDFVFWYAGEKFKNASNTSEKYNVVKDVVSMLVRFEDKAKITMYLDGLKNFGLGKRIWQQALEGERQRKEEDLKKSIHDTADEMDTKFGFHLEKNHYCSITERGSVVEWSNFILDPLFLVLDEECPKRLFEMRNELNQNRLVIMEPGDLVSLNQFRVKVEQWGNYIWKATEKELIKLKSYLFSKMETARQVSQLGWQKEGFFAFGNGAALDGEFHPTDDYGIVRMEGKGSFFFPAAASFNRCNHKQFAYEHQFSHKALSTVDLRTFSDQLFLVYGNNGRVGFAFALASLYKDIIIRKTDKYPILNLFGPKGSGKSDLAQSLMSLFMIKSKGVSLSNSSMPSLAQLAASLSNGMVHYEEYKNSLDPRRIELLKGFWDGIGRTKMLLDKSGKKETSAVDCAVIVTGQEMPTADIALFTRLIFLQHPHSEFTIEEKREHKKLMHICDNGLSHLTIDLLRHRDYFEKMFPTVYDEVFENVSAELENDKIEDRILKNWVTILAAYQTLEPVIGVSMSSRMFHDICLEGIRNQNKETKTNSELGDFWSMLQFLYGEGDFLDECDFKIVYMTELKTDIGMMEFKDPQPILFVQQTRIFQLYKMRSKAAGDESLPVGTLKHYIQNSRAYRGARLQRFYKTKKGERMVDVDKPTKRDGTPNWLVHSQRSYCFDYKLIKGMYGINLEGVIDNDEMEEDEPF